MIFLEADLSQAESRVVFKLTRDPHLQHLADLPSYEYDGHSENVKILGLDRWPNLDPKKARHVGKMTSHGCQRDMRGARLSGQILKELDIDISIEKCDGLIDSYHRAKPSIRGVYFKDIRAQLMRDKLLVNSWGRMWDVRWDRLDDELFRQAYSFLPQSEVADLMNQKGVKPVWLYCRNTLGYPPNLQVHDSLLISIMPDDAYDLAKFIEHSLRYTIVLAGSPLVIPVEFKLGLNWGANEKAGEGFEFKRLPSEEEFREKAWILERKRREMA